MEIFNELFGFFDQIALLAATAMGAAWLAVRSFIGRFGLALLTGLGRGAGSGIGVRFAGGGASSQLSSRRMPANPTQRHARQALWQAEARQQRMKLYVDAWFELVAARGGPFALSIHLDSLLNKSFRKKVLRLRNRCRAFDRLEDKAQYLIHRYENDYERKCEPFRNEVMRLSVELVAWKARHRRFRWRFWKRRWRYYKSQQIVTRRALTAAQWKLQRAETRLNMAYRSVIEPALVAVDQYERNYLTHWVQSFEADLESMRLTIVTGRMLDILFEPQHTPLRRHLGLHDLPHERISLRDHIVTYLEARGVGYGPLARLESLFESYLRVLLLSDPELCRRWNVNRTWLEHGLPAPGAIGVANRRHMHLSPVGGWCSRNAAEATKLSA